MEFLDICCVSVYGILGFLYGRIKTTSDKSLLPLAWYAFFVEFVLFCTSQYKKPFTFNLSFSVLFFIFSAILLTNLKYEKTN
jgi:predicted membrane-bound mannosyltransferase